MKQYEEIKRLIRLGDPLKAIAIFLEATPNNSYFEKKLILLENEFRQLKQKQRLGLSFDPELENQLIFKLLNNLDFYYKKNQEESPQNPEWQAVPLLQFGLGLLLFALALVGSKDCLMGSLLLCVLGIYSLLGAFKPGLSFSTYLLLFSAASILLYGSYLWFYLVPVESISEGAFDIDFHQQEKKDRLDLLRPQGIVALLCFFALSTLFLLYQQSRR